MLALSIRQPWAWAIIRPDLADPVERQIAIFANLIKDIENRSWPTRYRGRIKVHAAKGLTRDEYVSFVFSLKMRESLFPVLARLPKFEQLDRGGIIGEVDIVDCVTASGSPWFGSQHGFVLANSQTLPFTPYKGRLGFFDIPEVKP